VIVPELRNTRDVAIKRLDHVSVVVEDLAAALAFFTGRGAPFYRKDFRD
jgi:hypothetical protein